MDLRKLQSEIETKRSVEVFEILRADTNLFTGWSKFDIQKLCENIKILSFGRNSTIMQKNELVEYFAIILSGKLLIKKEDKVIGHLGAGDVLGYMAYLDFPGTKMNPFDITGDVEGYVAILRFDEFKLLSKKEPQLCYRITEMLGKKALNTVSLQYLGEEMYSPFTIKGTAAATNSKRVKDAMDTCPELAPFFEKFDQRDRKNLTKSFEYIEFDHEQRIVYEGRKSDYLLFLIKGELISFKENKPTVFYKPGAIIGKKEFTFELMWQENILGRVKGVILKLERMAFEEMIANSPTTAMNFIKTLVWYECKDLKTRYQDRSKFSQLQAQNIANPLDDFLEYEITKHMDFVNGSTQVKTLSNTKPFIKDFLSKKETLPLFMHNIHQSLQQPVQEEQLDKTKKSTANVQGCSFLREKLEKQLEEQRNKKGMKVKPVKVEKTIVDPRRHDDKQLDEDYEDLKNNYILLERENQELMAKLSEFMEETKGLKAEIRGLKELNMTASTKINKTLIHKELISKDLINLDPSSILTKNYNSAFSTFGDVLKEQHFMTAKAKRIAKYAYRWLAAVRTRKKLALQQL